uniref:Uncharacterized protein n=1 Tax=Oryza meridionalis TaxID=40149 RepID=A0A0E0FEK3_9ORYZ
MLCDSDTAYFDIYAISSNVKGDYSEGAVLIWNGEGKEVVNIQWINDCYIQGIKIPENDAVAIQALIKTPATCQGARDTIVSASK